MATLTGNDTLSIEIIDRLGKGVKVQDIPLQYGVSLDQAKRLSRFNNMLNSSKGHISELSHGRLKTLGLKSIVLSPIFKTRDWEGLEEILSIVTNNTTRGELTSLLPALTKKRERIETFHSEVEQQLSLLEKQKELLQEKLDRASYLHKQIEQKITFLKKYNSKVREFLIDHLGMSEDGHLCLAKRLDYTWQKNLLKKGILTFHEPPSPTNPHYDQWMKENKGLAYKYTVNDLDALAEILPQRWKREWDCAWNYEKENARVEKNPFFNRFVPIDPSYRNIDGLSSELRTEMLRIKDEIMQIQQEKKRIKQEINVLKKKSPKSFLEQVEASQTLSNRDVKRHGHLQDKAMKWLYQRGFACTPEFLLPNGRRVDVIGFNEMGHIVGVEVKASKSDFMRDTKWESYLEHCDEFYFLLAEQHWFQKDTSVGLLGEQGKSLELISEGKTNRNINNRTELIFSITRALSRKVTYGY